MTFFHFANCAVLAFAPYVIAYKYSSLSEYGSVWLCCQAAAVYFATQFIKLLTYASFFPAPEMLTPSALQYFVLNIADLYDIVGMHLAISYLYGRGEVRFLVTGYSWAFAHAVSTHLLPLAIGARKAAFSWSYMQRGCESNLDLIFFVGLAALVWLSKSSKRAEATHNPNRAAWILLAIALTRAPLLAIIEHIYHLQSWRLLLCNAAFTAFIGVASALVYLQNATATSTHSKFT